MKPHLDIKNNSLKMADLHHSFVQDVRKQVETEYKVAVDIKSGATAASANHSRKTCHSSYHNRPSTAQVYS